MTDESDSEKLYLYLKQDLSNGIEYVYIMSNESFSDDTFKIGWTRYNPEIRANTLQTSGVPTPFIIEYIINTPDGSKLEKLIHKHLKTYRIKDNREFFKISKDTLKEILTIELKLELKQMDDIPISKKVISENTEVKMYICKRCGIYFGQKGTLRNHLKRKMMCIAIENEISPAELLDDLESTKGINCKDCKKTYKNENSLRTHKCKFIKSVDNEEIEKLKKMFDAKIKELEKKIEINKPINITNNIDNSTTNNIVVINSINKAGSDPIKYLLEQSAESILKWFNGMDGLLAYLEEKFFNEEHTKGCLPKQDLPRK